MKESVQDTCPACGQAYGAESTRTSDCIKCACCGYEKLLRTPLQKKRENTVLKQTTKFSDSTLAMVTVAYAVMFLPLVLHILFGPQSFSGFREAHPVGSIVYLVLLILVYIGLPIGIVITGVQNRRVRKLGYNMEALRSYYAGQLHKNRNSKTQLKFVRDELENWEKQVAEYKDLIG